MTTDDKIFKIKELEHQFLEKIEGIKKEYQATMKELVSRVEKKKIEDLRKDLGI
jgi:hypothetical protein